jgi:rhodanese-related sulfurtransferase
MKPVLSMLSVLVLLSANAPTCHAQDGFFSGLFGGAKVPTISTEKIQELLIDPKSGRPKPELPPEVVVVDVRSDEEIGVSVIPGAVTKEQFEKNRSEYRGRTVIPYCTVGGRSGAYAKKLAADGVRVLNYKGSILEWVRAGLPLVTLDGEPTRRVHTYSDRYSIPAEYEQVAR